MLLLLTPRFAYAQTPTVDDFNPGAKSEVHSLAVQADGKILVGGDFTSLGGQTRNYIGRVNPDGTLDAGFNPGASGTVSSLVVQTDGKILMGGDFTRLGGQPRSHIGRLNEDGTLDMAFNPGASGAVSSFAVQPDGKILVGGKFTTLGGQTRNSIGRLNPDGTLDTGFNPGVSNSVYSLAVQPDGKILVGGDFTSLGGQTRNYIGRVNPDGTLDTGFNPAASGSVYSLTVQADGKILVGGVFTALGVKPRNYIGRLNPDGRLDMAFNPGAGGPVYSLAVQLDGKILVGGYFSTLGSQPRHCIRRLSPDGTWDTSFDPGADNTVYTLAVQADGKVVVGGRFTTFGGQVRNYIGRLNPTDPTTQSFSYDDASTITWLRGGSGPEVWRTVFDWSSDGLLWTSLGEGTRVPGGWQRTNAIVPAQATLLRARGFVSGDCGDGSNWFVESYRGPLLWLGQPVSRTNDVGSTATFGGPAGGTPPLAYQWFKDEVAITDGAHIAGATTAWLTLADVTGADTGSYHLVVSNAYGAQTSLVATLTVNDPVVTASPVSQNLEPGGNAILKVIARGTAPLSYQWWKDGVALDGRTKASVTLTNARVEDAGGYRAVVSGPYGSVTSSVAWLTVNMVTLDAGFAPQVGGGDNLSVYSLVVQGDGKTLVGGRFTTLDGQTRSHLGRLNPDGTLDTDFNPGANGYVYSLAVQADGKILVGGKFTTLGGRTRSHLGRLNPDGTLDTDFNPGVNGNVYSLAIQADGKILVSGKFTTLAGQTRNCIGRLNRDGTLDASFNSGAGGAYFGVFSLAVQADGKILVGGDFVTLNEQPRSWIGRLNPDGTLDADFNPGARGARFGVYSLAVQADGKILVGGDFATLNEQPRSWIGRLNPDGTLDADFNPGVGGGVGGGQFGVYSLAVQADGKVLMGGGFTTLGGQTRKCIGRLNPDGTLDNAFNPGASNSVCSLAVQADGRILVGGDFNDLGGQTRNYLARLNATDPATQSLTYDNSRITWIRRGTSPEVWRTTFEYSTNGVEWVILGAGTRIPEGWQLTEVPVPTNSVVRARGHITGGANNGSSWFVESLLTIGNPRVPPVLSVESVTGESMWFKLTGGTNAQYAVQTATNLPSADEWQPVTTLTLTNGWGRFGWTNTGDAHRFFRAK